ncbi:MAG: hypothetical protein ABSH41_15130 [Syntrophobacteraceae bacterium]
MERGKPVRYMAVESCEKVRRNVFCRNYGECLAYTIRKKWPGFSCQDCESYEQEMPNEQELNDDYARCVAFALVTGVLDPMAPTRLRDHTLNDRTDLQPI